MTSPPDAWAIEASSLPLAFSQVREDPRLDLKLAEHLPAGATVVMIASGGETAACLGQLPLRLHLVDMNPAQLALSRLKWNLALKGNAGEAMAILGHALISEDERREKLANLLDQLGLKEDVLGPTDIVSRLGPDHAGRYEVTFAKLRTKLDPWRPALDVALQSESPVSTLRGSDLGNALHAAFLDVMKLENLVCLFGTVATQNPKRSFGEHFAARTLGIFERMPPCSNPFLWQILAGKFPPGHCYDWLNPFHAPTADAHWHCGKMDDVLDSLSPESADLVHLSNILDWLPAESAQAMLDKACRVLKPGGLIIIRQLNSTLDIPSINSKFVWDEELGRSMEQTDRSYFYPGIFIGRRA